MSVVTALTAQNTTGVTGIHAVPPDFVVQQMAAVFSDIGTDAVKIGMLYSAELIQAEGTSALRRATIAQRFNRGYRNYRRTYRRCTPSARSSIARFVKEARELSNRLIKLAK